LRKKKLKLQCFIGGYNKYKEKAMKNSNNWMQNLNLKKGSLRKTLGVKKGQKIPLEQLDEAAKGEGVSKKTAKRARLAEVFRKSFHGKKD
jgi:hypothetical protein